LSDISNEKLFRGGGGGEGCAALPEMVQRIQRITGKVCEEKGPKSFQELAHTQWPLPLIQPCTSNHWFLWKASRIVVNSWKSVFQVLIIKVVDTLCHGSQINKLSFLLNQVIYVAYFQNPLRYIIISFAMLVFTIIV